MKTPKSVLFVCLGNICRSPSAEAILRAKASQQGLDIHFDSAGTAGYHIGAAPDDRAIATGRDFGYALDGLRARQVTAQDFYDFDVIFAMDNDNLKNLQALAPKDATASLSLFDKVSVADPYYGDMRDFHAMFVHIERTADHWLDLWQSV